ncbi:QcrA and Rieske domain-containing protein [Lacipirellula limnantheis]|uniref:Cytochrome b6-f complex iron-sulfur subunit n=1 Tax=Lacipirellula limnantheis TaxID=2528024 RepID=A0A517U2X3_9BACT|nr:Rieske 2Fe-2S domain-containing protein [Lacipirellula limnantheis]QDT74975.1 Cytochrome b6-f complex iron-sulfur subunit [Lacipirellula limnantheis]
MSDQRDLSPRPSTSILGRPVENRRSFFAITAAVVTGSIAVLTPIGVGIAAFLTPLFRKSKSPEVRIALLDQVPDDGMPRYFPVVADREDAWTRYPAQRVGAVYLIRNAGEEKPTAFTAKCPHAGCFIGYTPGAKVFQCPCHTSAFKLNGERLNGDAEVAPRGMDTLPVSIRQAKTGDGTEIAEVWVEFIDFQTGHKEKIPTA